MQNRDPRRPGESERERLNRTDPRFKKDLEESEPYVYRSGRWFQDQGFWVTRPGKFEKYKDKETDIHDLWTGRIVISRGQEVKSRRGWNFYSLADFTAMGGRFGIGTLATVNIDTYYRMGELLDCLESIPVTYQQWSEDGSGLIEIDIETTMFQTFQGVPIWVRCWQPSTLANCDKVVIKVPIFTWHGRPVMMGRELQTIYRLPAREIDQGLRPVKGVRYLNESMLQKRVEDHKAKLRKAKRVMQNIRWMIAEKQGDKFVEEYPLEQDPGDPKTRREAREKPLEEAVAMLF